MSQGTPRGSGVKEAAVVGEVVAEAPADNRPAPPRPARAAGKAKAKAVKIPPLRLHRNGQWFMTRRIHGVKRFFYFGRDQAEAQRAYLGQVKDILAGQLPVTTDPDHVSVLEVTDRFIIAQEERFRAGDIGIREFDDLRKAALLFRQFYGGATPMARVTDLERYRTFLKGRFKLNSFNRFVTKTKKMLRWAFKKKPRPLLTAPLHEDDALAKARHKHVKRERREAEAAHGKPIYSPLECRLQLIAAAEAEDWELLAFVLLGLNGGMGQSHIADLPAAVVDLEAGYVNWVRTKTEELFQLTLWPVTVEAVRRTVGRRPKPARREWQPLLFLTRFGNPWVQEYFDEGPGGTIGDVAPNDEIGKQHRKLEDRLTVTELRDGQEVTRPMKRRMRAFYAFRRTFTTVANDTKDKDAVRRIQGQGLTGMDPHYVREIPVERLRAVTDYVHERILGHRPNELTLATLVAKLKEVDRPARAGAPAAQGPGTSDANAVATPPGGGAAA